MGGIRRDKPVPRRRLSDAEVDEIVRREHAGAAGQRSKYGRGARHRHVPGAVAQSPCTTSGFLRCCDRFYARIDRDIREYDFELNLKLGVGRFVRMARKERRHAEAMRRIVRADIARREVGA